MVRSISLIFECFVDIDISIFVIDRNLPLYRISRASWDLYCLLVRK